MTDNRVTNEMVERAARAMAERCGIKFDNLTAEDRGLFGWRCTGVRLGWIDDDEATRRHRDSAAGYCGSDCRLGFGDTVLMTRYAAATSVPPERSRVEIESTLERYGATGDWPDD